MQSKNTLFRTCPDDDALTLAADILRQGGLVAFPTETVYGLGGDALDPTASMRIYAAKGRPSDNPLIVHIADKKDVYALAEEVPPTANMLIEAFWPGPLTIILKKKPIVPDATTGGLPTVAIRMPSHPAAMEMIRRSGVYVAAPSANRSGRPSPTTAAHVAEDLDGVIDMILDGGPVGIGIESTIVDLTSDVPMILRPGLITKEMLEAIVGPVDMDPSLVQLDEESTGDINTSQSDIVASAGDTSSHSQMDTTKSPTLAGDGNALSENNAPGKSIAPALDFTLQHPKAPGMRYTHYAPQGTLSIITDHAHPEQVTPTVTAEILRLAGQALQEGRETAVLTTGENASAYDELAPLPHFHLILLGDADDGQTVAAHLYGALRDCDALGCEVIYSESFRRDALGSAIMNRLVKAAGHRILVV
ncbi:MAG: threonylcarbamoyl-AMP synthase [Eubacterium sp.]|nr:threonylcarbamoyl-AMP synthase [Eubacterium sp.]